METKSNPVELTLAENVAILGAGNFFMGAATNDPRRTMVGAAQFDAAFQLMGEEGLKALGKKLDVHADSLGGAESLLDADTDIPSEAPAPVSDALTDGPVSDERPVFLNEKEALLLGAGLNVASAIGTGDPGMAAAAMGVYIDAAKTLGLDGQKTLEVKLNGSFDLFVARED